MYRPIPVFLCHCTCTSLSIKFLFPTLLQLHKSNHAKPVLCETVLILPPGRATKHFPRALICVP